MRERFLELAKEHGVKLLNENERHNSTNDNNLFIFDVDEGVLFTGIFSFDGEDGCWVGNDYVWIQTNTPLGNLSDEFELASNTTHYFSDNIVVGVSDNKITHENCIRAYLEEQRGKPKLDLSVPDEEVGSIIQPTVEPWQQKIIDKLDPPAEQIISHEAFTCLAKGIEYVPDGNDVYARENDDWIAISPKEQNKETENKLFNF